ncbi:putative dithiol-disulfide isomerase involved in polyketide biosynthesis [Rivularia sp. PCC 7116]|uniref:DsbA family oxidoreductase n=1 Tax=Rivularia sp. PCC 7116 TaxID=373994 RepID=UPI00029F402B|nr:DsbA family oxidoreductase [Rivularia sp. PCC 7116]AFY54430.1 putative dithiol-disulfide isomerase involved in polyketide biosynthesis [Rivularia sp. PCC 7116]
MQIDIFHDTVCPWCRIGKKHLFDALSEYNGEAVDIRWHPFLLDNSVPSGGYEFRDFMQERKGISLSQLQQMFDYTQRMGEAAGVVLDFTKVRLAVNTTLSHRLIELTPEDSKAKVVEAIYQAYFEEGLNLGNIEVILAIAKSCGIDFPDLALHLNDKIALNAIVMKSDNAHSLGINSVPFFIINNEIKVIGSQSKEAFVNQLTVNSEQ